MWEKKMNEIINQLINLDGQVLMFIQEHLRFSEISPIVVAITKLGNGGFIWIVLSVLLLFPKKTRRAGILSLVALLGSLCITNFFLKNYVARVRPYEVVEGLHCLVERAKDWSFPSGHASAAFASAVVIYKSRPKRLGVPCMILAFAIALSRLYVGIHYPSDVICGAVIGTLIGLIVFWLFGEKKYKKKARREARRRRR